MGFPRRSLSRSLTSSINRSRTKSSVVGRIIPTNSTCVLGFHGGCSPAVEPTAPAVFTNPVAKATYNGRGTRSLQNRHHPDHWLLIILGGPSLSLSMSQARVVMTTLNACESCRTSAEHTCCI